MEDTLKARFFSRLIKSDGCWTLTGKPNTYKYHFIHYRGKKWYAHRISLEWKIGRTLLSGEEACHSCDNPSCVNPDHLWAGTHKENMHDSLAKGRSNFIYNTMPRKLMEFCKNGHLFDVQNTKVYTNKGRPTRRCIACSLEYQRKYNKKRSTPR